MTAVVSGSRQLAVWSLAIFAVGGSLLGWVGLYTVARTFAAGTAWWVGAVFLASGPAAVAGLVSALRPPRLTIPPWLNGLALIVFVLLWILLLAFKLAA